MQWQCKPADREIDSKPTIETTISHGVQQDITDGEVSVLTGADADEFYTFVVWRGSSLVFSIEEYEDGRILLSKET